MDSRPQSPWQARPAHSATSLTRDAQKRPPPQKVWMHGWETLITTAPPPLPPKTKPNSKNHRTPITRRRLPKLSCLFVALLAILPGQLRQRQRQQLCRGPRSSPRSSFLRPLSELLTPTPSLLSLPPPFLPSRGPRTHPETPSALGYSHCGLTQPTRHSRQSSAGSVRGPGADAKWGCGWQGTAPLLPAATPCPFSFPNPGLPATVTPERGLGGGGGRPIRLAAGRKQSWGRGQRGGAGGGTSGEATA